MTLKNGKFFITTKQKQMSINVFSCMIILTPSSLCVSDLGLPDMGEICMAKLRAVLLPVCTSRHAYAFQCSGLDITVANGL